MIITNKLGLPNSLVRAVTTEKHNRPNCISATSLLQGAKQFVLSDRHWEEMEDDVSDRIWAVFGTAVHSLLQDYNEEDFVEERFECKVGEKTVTGQVDLYSMTKEEINDWKTASVWKVVKGDFSDWKKQGLIYSWLLKQSGLNVRKCRFIAMLKDFSQTKAKTDAGYPKSPVYVYEYDVTEKDLEEIEIFIRNKVEEITKAEHLTDDDIPPCSPSERWQSETTYAVKKEGRKTAVRVLNDKELADKLVESLGNGHYVEIREGVSGRCAGYCGCCEFCNFYHENVKSAEVENVA